MEAGGVVRAENVGGRQGEFVEEMQEFRAEEDVGAGNGEERDGLRTGG